MEALGKVGARMSERVVLGCLVVCVALLLPGLGSCTSGPPSDAPGTTGTVTAVETGSTGDEPALVMLVEGGSQPEGAVSDRATVTITESTRVFAADGSEAAVDDLSEGVGVKVWFSGPVAESYPVQGTASDVQLTSD